MTAMHPSTVPFASALAGLFTSAAFALATDYTSVEAIAGKPVQLSTTRRRIKPAGRGRHL
jgi:hypothetical protein